MATVNEKAARIAKSGKASIEIWTSKPRIINQQNFVSSPSMPNWLTLSRLTAATRFDNTGTLVDVAADTARFDYAYNGTGWVNQGLLLEKQSTNLQRYSTGDQYTNWNVNSASNTTLSAAPTSFAGVSGARVSGTSTGTNFSRAILPAKSISVGDVLAISFRASLGTSGNIKCGFGVVGSEGYHLNNGSWTTGSSANYTISNALGVIEDGIARVKYTLNVNTAHAGLPSFVGTNNSGAVYNDIYWVQLETLPYASSFIKTTNAQVTRPQDNLQLNFSNYTGSVKFRYKRQDTDAVETSWVDFINSTLPMLTSNFNVGIWLQGIEVYNRILTAQEKANA